MAALPRGFKAEAKKIALAERCDLKIDLMTPYNPYDHAERYGISVVTLSQVGCRDCVLQHFSVENPATFSGMLVPNGTGFVIVINGSHGEDRLRSTVAHEMAHLVLEHPGDVLLSLGDECRSGASSRVEAEAAELSGELLIPHNAALRVARWNWTDDQVADHFNVSLRMAGWRLNGSGVRKRVQNERASRLRRGA